MNKKKNKDFINAIEDPSNWSPSFTKINRKIGVSNSTLYTRYQKLIKQRRIAVKVIIEVFDEDREHDKWQKDKQLI